MANKKQDKQKYGDIVENHDLIKRTLMVAAFPALITTEIKDGDTFFKGFLPGFEFANIEDIEDEDECVEYLQDMLDDEVEELVVFGKSLPNIEDDEKLLKKYPDYKIVYLDINVYATKEELDYYDNCTHNCSCCEGHCCDDEDYDEDCDCCGDEDCDCDDDCDCGDDCGCGDNCDCGDDCGDENCDCCDEDSNDDCCKEEHNKKMDKKHNCNCGGEHKHKDNCCGKGDGSCKNKKNKKN